MSISLRAIAPLLVPALLMVPSGASGQSDAALRIAGVVVSQAVQSPLGHSMITLQPIGREMFSDDQGRFAFAGLPPGRYRMRVAHLGFAPKEIPLDVSADSTVTRVRIELDAVQVRLATVRVTAAATCTLPGRPDPMKERDLVTVLDQLEQNARQYRLLADSFPYSYLEERTTFAVRSDSVIMARRIDTLLLRSNDPTWTYHAGHVLSDNTGQGMMHLPLLSDFASDDFIKSHCFRYGGVVQTLEGPAVRIDFRADDKLKAPDVNGSILLDAASYQIRSAVLQLSRIPDPMSRFVSRISATTLFREVEPSILVISHVHGVTTMYPPRLDIIATASNVDDQTLLVFGFVGPSPGRPSQRPH
jgi:hypothetical protein